MAFSVTMAMVGVLVLAVSIQIIVTQTTEGDDKKKVCQYQGEEFQVGDLVTGDKCDRCFCTQHGIMCEMIKCEVTQCYDKVIGECCYECPNGRNCLLEGENGTLIVPETGCLYSDGIVCSCYFDNQAVNGEARCEPFGPGDEGASFCTAMLP